MNFPHALSLGDLRQPSSQTRARIRWGNWVLRRRNWTLVYITHQGHELYEIDLEQMTTAAQMLDWIFQACRKLWATPEYQADLIRALSDIFTPQATLCSGGTSKTLDAARWLREQYPKAGRQPEKA